MLFVNVCTRLFDTSNLTRVGNLKLMTKQKFPKSILSHSMLDNQLYLSFLINSILFYWSSCRVRFCKCLKDSLFTCWLRFSGNFNIWQALWVVHVMSKCLSRFRPKVKFLLDLESFEMHFYPHVDSCYRKGQVLSLTNELISAKFELVKFFKRIFSIIVFIFEVFET